MKIDFLIQEKTLTKAKISTIELKLGKNYTYKSLGKYKTKLSSGVKEGYILHTKDLMCKNG